MRGFMPPKLRRRHHTLAILPVAVCACLTSACFGLRARAVMAPTPLDMPEPPPRVVEVREPDVPPPIPLPEEPVRNTPTRPPSRPPEPARPAQPPPVAETPVDAAKPEELTPRTPTTLQTTPTQREEEVERRIWGLLGQAKADLNRINYQALTSDGRTQYEQAKRFISQAEDALQRARNFVYANNLADKAATIAAQLLGR
jgi:outer membrane biosynthesis protein TonB